MRVGAVLLHDQYDLEKEHVYASFFYEKLAYLEDRIQHIITRDPVNVQ